MRMSHKEVGALLVTFYLLSYVAISVPLGIYFAGVYCNWSFPCDAQGVVEPIEPRLKLVPTGKLRSIIDTPLDA